MSASYQPPPSSVGHAKRIDLHCHSRASTEADEAVLLAIQCPESYSEPQQVYEQAKRRAMDFVTITDHDAINGVMELSHVPDVMIGEELTCWFPEDQCKMHVLVWGIDRTIHDTLQKLAPDIYQVAGFIARNRIAHSVAHPLYRQNGLLERWHLERLLLMFKGFECLNGAHSMLHRDAFEPMLDELDEKRILQLQRAHELTAQWPKPWIKARTGGSDDHGLFNIGRTWTEFPAGVTTVAEVLECLREGMCRPGGEAGSSVKLAHNFFGVGIRYYTRQFSSPGSKSDSSILERLVGDSRGALSRLAAAKSGVKYLGGKILRETARAFKLRGKARGTELLGELLFASAIEAIENHDFVRKAFCNGRAPLAEHAPMFSFMSEISRRTAQGIGDSIASAIKQGQLGPILDSVSTVLGHQAILLPYYFALFHQNQERHLLSQITGHGRAINRNTLRVAVFTDSLDPQNAAGRFARVLAETAGPRRSKLSIAVCSEHEPALLAGSITRFKPLAEQDLGASGKKIAIPPVLELLEWADRGQFDVIIANTCGPVGLCGWLAAQMLRAPCLAMFHGDLSADVLMETGGDYRLTAAARGYAKWFYRQAERVLTTSRAGSAAAAAMGVDRARISSLPAPVDLPAQVPIEQRHARWERHRVREPLRLVCPLRGCRTSDLGLLVATFERVAREREDVALVLDGKCPGKRDLKSQLRGLPAYFVKPAGVGDARQLNASGDLLLCPAQGDFNAHDALEALFAGVPVITRAGTAAAEALDRNAAGCVIEGSDPTAWSAAILALVADTARRRRLGLSGRRHAQGIDRSATFDAVWNTCLGLVQVRPPVPADSSDADQTDAYVEAAQI